MANQWAENDEIQPVDRRKMKHIVLVIWFFEFSEPVTSKTQQVWNS